MNGTAPNQQKTASGALTGIYTGKSKYLRSAVTFSHPATGKSYTTPSDDLGLWDTGCSSMTMTEAAAHALGLVDENGDYYGKDNAAVPSGCSAPVNFGYVTIADGTTTLQPLWDVTVELPGGLSVASVRTHVAAQPLIGMGVIGQGDFAVSGAGSGTTFSFRLPAKAAIDFTSSRQGGGKVLLKRSGSSV